MEKIDKKNVHNFLNNIYYISLDIKELLEKIGILTKMNFHNGNYTLIDKKHQFQGYPIIILENENFDIGFDLDKIFIDISPVKISDISIKLLEKLNEEFDYFEIYGYHNFKEDYFKNDNLLKSYEKIISSKESFIQMTFYIDYNCNFIDNFKKIKELLF